MAPIPQRLVAVCYFELGQHTHLAVLIEIFNQFVIAFQIINLDRFTIDRLVTILNRLDRDVQVHITVQAGATGDQAPVLGADFSGDVGGASASMDSADRAESRSVHKNGMHLVR